MALELLMLAEKLGIIIEYWDFEPPLDAVYWAHPGLPPVIGMGNHIFENSPEFRCILGEELSHHFESSRAGIPCSHYHYRDRLAVSRAEYIAKKKAALYFMPLDKLRMAFRQGIRTPWELAEHFNVTEELVRFRLMLPDLLAIKKVS